jgi:hypothetical protein
LTTYNGTKENNFQLFFQIFIKQTSLGYIYMKKILKNVSKYRWNFAEKKALYFLEALYFLRCKTILGEKFQEKCKISKNNLPRTPPQTCKFVLVQGYLLESNFKFGENYLLPKKLHPKKNCRKQNVFLNMKLMQIFFCYVYEIAYSRV